MKLPKEVVLYRDEVPATPFFRYRCDKCPLFNQTDESCIIVEGEIQSQKWCILWIPKYPPMTKEALN